MELIRKIIKYKLGSSSKMQFTFLYPKGIQNFFWKTINFVKNLEMTQKAGGRGDHVLCVIMTHEAMRTKIDMLFTL